MNPLLRKISTGYCKSGSVAGDVTVGEFLERIKNGTFEELVSAYRESLQRESMGLPLNRPEKDANAIKLQLLGAMFSGTFSERSIKKVTSRSGVICVDVDGVPEHEIPEVRRKIQALPQTLACFVSPSGMGVKALLLGHTDRPHIEMFRAADKLMRGIGIAIDQACKDVSRLCFGSLDPDLYVNEHAEMMSYSGIEPSDALESDGRVGRNKSPEQHVENTPGNDYDNRGDFFGLLEKHGWRRKDAAGNYWIRPGKTDDGHSASFNMVGGLSNAFYVFSSNAAPFIAGRTYRPWHVFSMLEYGGEYGLAAAALRAQGFGVRPDHQIAGLEGISELLPPGWELSATDLAGRPTPEFAWTLLQRNSDFIKTRFKTNSELAMSAFAGIYSFVADDEFHAHKMRKWWGDLTGKLPETVLKNKAAQIKKEREKLERQRAKAESAKKVGETIEETQKENPIYYDEDKGAYYRRVGERYGKMTRADALLELACKGLRREATDGALVSPAEEALHSFQCDNAIDAAGPLCGRPAGLHILAQGLRFLATNSPRIIPAKAGECPTILQVVRGLLGAGRDEHGEMQFNRLIWWIKHGRRAIKNYTVHTPGHALFLIGPKGVGKTLLQSKIIRPCLGGRSADPMNHMTDKTTFNSDLWKAELLVIDDGVLGSAPSRENREMFRGKVKSLVANETQPFHPKGKEQLHMTPIWRVTLSFNTDYDSMQNIPPVSNASDDSFSDKCLMFLCHTPDAPFFDASDPDAREEFDRKIAAEIPAFIHLVETTDIPQEFVDTRHGFKAWQHPTVLEGLAKTAGSESAESLFRQWVEQDSTDGKKEGTRGVIVKGDILQIYTKFRSFWCGGNPARIDPRFLEKVCPGSRFEHYLKRLMEQPEWAPFITNRHNYRAGVDVRKGWAVFGANPS